MASNGGPAFPIVGETTDEDLGNRYLGMSLRDWFAGMVQADDRLVKAVRGMDDHTLAIFARCPDSEAEYFGETADKYVQRYGVEAKAIARVRYMQADAMLAAREKRDGKE